MQRIPYELPLDGEVIFAGDQHGGSQLTYYEGIDYLVNYISSNKKRRLILTGDNCEAIMVDDKRFSQDGVKEPVPLKQAKEQVKIFMPIKKQIIVVLLGNHERKLLKFGNIVEEIICDDLNVPYGTMTSRICFTNKGRFFFNAFITHHMPSLRSNAKDPIQAKANIEAALKKTLQDRIGDCAVMVGAHTHQLLAVQPTEKLFVVDGKKGVKQKYTSGSLGNGDYIHPDFRYYGSSGSFRKHYVDGIDDYGEAYAPVELGFLSLKLDGGKVAEWKKIIV